MDSELAYLVDCSETVAIVKQERGVPHLSVALPAQPAAMPKFAVKGPPPARVMNAADIEDATGGTGVGLMVGS